MVKIMRCAVFVAIVAWLVVVAAAQPGGNEADRKNVQMVFEKYVYSVPPPPQ